MFITRVFIIADLPTFLLFPVISKVDQLNALNLHVLFLLSTSELDNAFNIAHTLLSFTRAFHEMKVNNQHNND
jgi:hypothetical protein